MTMIEDELRATFMARTQALPAVADPAGAAIARARVIRRRHNTFGVALVAVFVLLASGGVWREHALFRTPLNRTGPFDNAAAFVPTFGVLMDVRVGQELWSTDGRHYPLPGVGRVTWVHRVTTGWLYGGEAKNIRLLTMAGQVVDPAIDGPAVVVSSDGARVAWQRYTIEPDTYVAAGRLTTGPVADVATLKLPPGTDPVGFADNKLLLRQIVADQAAQFDFWSVGKNYTPTWSNKITDMYGQFDGSVVGTVTVLGERCLALFSTLASGLREAQHRCGLGLSTGEGGVLSPDGRRLALRTDAELRVLDLHTFFSKPVTGAVATSANADSSTPGNSTPGSPASTVSPTASIPAKQPAAAITCSVEGPVGVPVWVDTGRVVVSTRRGWASCDANSGRQLIDEPELARVDWSPVPRNA